MRYSEDPERLLSAGLSIECARGPPEDPGGEPSVGEQLVLGAGYDFCCLDTMFQVSFVSFLHAQGMAPHSTRILGTDTEQNAQWEEPCQGR